MMTRSGNPEVHPEDGHFTPKMRGRISLRGAALHPEDEAEKLRGALRGNGGNPPIFVGRRRSYTRVSVRDNSLLKRELWGFLLQVRGAQRRTPEATPKIGALASLRPNFGVRGGGARA